MRPMEPERARARLAEERTRIDSELARLGGPVSTDEQPDSDQAAELDEAEREEAIREELEGIVAAIERAEERLEEGTYGISVVSGEPIPDERLELVPWADRKADER
jgi:RNA polymerase-binding transcription factor